MAPLAAALLLALDTENAHEEKLPEARRVESYSGALRFDLPMLRLRLVVFGGAGDPLAQDPLRREDYLGPELSLPLPRDWSLRAQAAKALRTGSGDTATLLLSCSF